MTNSDAPLTQHPIVSAIIPAYNYGRFVGQAIQSALDQDYRPLEVIVCDDASTDDTAQVLAGFGDAIVSIRGQHRGVSAARNLALKYAKGHFIAMLDADDLWLPGKVSRQVEAMLARPAAAVCHTGCELFGTESGDGPIEAARRERIQGRCFEKIFYMNGIILSSAMVRRDALPPGGFEEDLAGPEDFSLFLNMLFEHEAVYLPQVLTRYRRHGSQTTHDGARRIQVQVGIARLRVLERFGPRLQREQREAMRDYALNELKVCTYSRYWQGDWVNARRGFRAMRQNGLRVPWRHRLKAWISGRLSGRR